MYDQVRSPPTAPSSALWNLAYDGGMGLGAAGFGVIALHTGYPVAFALTAALPCRRACRGALGDARRRRFADRGAGACAGCFGSRASRDRREGPLDVRRPLSWLSWSAHHLPSGTRRGLRRDER